MNEQQHTKNKWFCPKTSFDREAKANSKAAYCKVHVFVNENCAFIYYIS